MFAKTPALFIIICAVVQFSLAPSAAANENDDGRRAGEEFFERKVRPLLSQHCYSCHSDSAGKTKGSLSLDTRTGLLRGGSRGPAVIAGRPKRSLLIQAVRYEHDELAMPPSEMLPPREIQTLTTWITLGAPIPESQEPARQPPSGRHLWSFQPPRQYPLPTTGPWVRMPIDAFVLEQLGRHGLAPSPEADRRTLIRRATFDLTGLPPTPQDVTDFVADDSLGAYGRLIDRLIASPQYGERWARFWLDLARYTDTTAKWLKSTGQAWLYRDWIVRALNQDLAYDEFAKRQLATDLMSDTGPDDLPALGFLGLSPTYWKELRLAPEVIRTVVAEEWDERIDAVTRTFLGLTVACARCHDHKFDPIRTEDYYALAGVFASCQLVDRPLLPADQASKVLSAQMQVHELEAELQEAKTADPERAQTLQAEIAAIEKKTPNYNALRANAVVESSMFVVADGPEKSRLEYRHGEVRDLPIFLRGNPENHGPIVPRRFLEALSSDESQPFRQGSGRLELAEAIFREGQPLSSRVIVNRIWKEHFGHGLVDTPSNFGTQGQRPTHAELLDDLAARFAKQGWSLKWLHREIMLSATYRQSSRQIDAYDQLDPENRWLWRTNRRRLDVEMWRDAMLDVAGQLDLAVGGPPIDLDRVDNFRRTLYGKIGRRELNDMLRLYDFPAPTAHSPAREITTTPLQQLFVLNSAFMQCQAEILTRRVDHEGQGLDRDAKVQLSYQLVFARQATELELRLANQYLASAQMPQDGRIWQQYLQVLLGLNEFMFVD